MPLVRTQTDGVAPAEAAGASGGSICRLNEAAGAAHRRDEGRIGNRGGATRRAATATE
jgi:hypothetical protein